jgi:hypothetical protein
MATTMSYSEQRQQAYFDMARRWLRIATEVLDDTLVGTPSFASFEWAKDHAAKHARQAREFEDKGYEEGFVSGQVQASLTKAHNNYGKAIDRFQKEWARLYPDQLAAETVGQSRVLS